MLAVKVAILYPVILTFEYSVGSPVSARTQEDEELPKPIITDWPLGPPCCKQYNPPPPYAKTPRPNRFREGKCKDGNKTYQVGDTWNYDPECVERECKEDGTVVINKCPPVPEVIPEGWELKADSVRSNNFFPFCCKKAVPPPDPKVPEPGCYSGNSTIKVGEQVDIPGRCYFHVCTGTNEWTVAECGNLGSWKAWEVLPPDLTKSYPDCCGRAVPILNIVPDIFEDLPSANYLGVAYDSASVDYGNELTPSQVLHPPSLTNPSPPSIPGEPFLTQWDLLIMIDPDVSIPGNSESGEFLHWMVGNFQGNNISSGQVIAEYVGAVPTKGTGMHRYIFFLYNQPGKLDFDEMPLKNTTVGWRGNFLTRKFAEKYKLGSPKAFNVFRAQWDESVSEVLKQFGIEEIKKASHDKSVK